MAKKKPELPAPPALPPPPPPAPPAPDAPPADAERLHGTNTWVKWDKPAQAQAAIIAAIGIYMNTPGISVRRIWEAYLLDESDPESPAIRDMIGMSTLQRAAALGKWKRRREKLWQDAGVRVMEAFQSQIVQRTVHELGRLEEASDVIFQKLVGPDAPKVKSFEGALGAFLAVDKRMSEKRNEVAQVATAAAMNAQASLVDGEEGPIVPDFANPPVLEDGLSDAQILNMAKAAAATAAGLTAKPKPKPQSLEPDEDYDEDDEDTDDDTDDGEE